TRVHSILGKNLPLVRGDPDRLRQVIHNLLQNAQDALAGSDDPRIEVATELSRGQVWLRISDNGCGFPEAIIKGAFEPYVTTKPKGTGLGLAIVKRIIDEHHGTVTIENRSGREGGRGAAGRISLPRAASPTWRRYSSSTTKSESGNCSRRYSRTRGTRCSSPRTPRLRARCVHARGPTWCCSISGCPTPTASRCSRSGPTADT